MAISTLIEFLCIFLYAIYFTKLPIVKYYRAKAASEGSKTVAADLAAAGIKTETNDQVRHLQQNNTNSLILQNHFFLLCHDKLGTSVGRTRR